MEFEVDHFPKQARPVFLVNLKCNHVYNYVVSRSSQDTLKFVEECPVVETWTFECGHQVKLSCEEYKEFLQSPKECPYAEVLCDRTTCARKLHPATCAGTHCPCKTPCPPCPGRVHYLNKAGDGQLVLNCPEFGPWDKGFTWEEDSTAPSTYVTLTEDWRVAPTQSRQNCGHQTNKKWQVKVPRWQVNMLSQAESNYLCQKPCSEINPECGHKCKGTCGRCFQGRFHARCEEPWESTLICGHRSSGTCGNKDPSCLVPCQRKCAHKRCDKSCASLCEWECKEKCTYFCDHGQCTRLCDEPCDKLPCTEPCTKLLACNHPCVGFCGEVCPPYCRFCNKEALEVGAAILLGEIEDTDRFIYLEECGHAIPSDCMDQWMATEPEGGEIVPKCCPVCRRRLNRMHRYDKITTDSWELVEAVKLSQVEKKVDGGKLVNKLEKWFTRTFLEISRKPNDWNCPEIIIHIGKYLRGGNRSRLNLTMVQFLLWMAKEWKHARNQNRKLTGFPAKFHEDVDALPKRWREFLEYVSFREWPLNEEEQTAFLKEYGKLDNQARLYHCAFELFKEDLGAFDRFLKDEGLPRNLFLEANQLAKADNGQKEFEEKLEQFKTQIKVTVVLPRHELDQIVKSFGDRRGRWFKCPNGHVYVVTECGGATQVATCPECGASIGGNRHRVMASNAIAVEMDGARMSMWDESARNFVAANVVDLRLLGFRL